METEELLRPYPIDGAVLMGGCDKTTPGLLMGAESMDLPAIFLSAGPMLRGHWGGTTLGSGSDTWKYWADLQVPIGCGGVAVYPGDVLVADRDGIIVVPRALAAELADPALEQERLEAYVATKIRAGLPLAGNYPPGEETTAEYKRLLAEAGPDGPAPAWTEEVGR